MYLLSSLFFSVFLSTLLSFPSPHPLSLYPLFPIPRLIILGILIVCCEETNALPSFSSALVLLIGIHSTHCSNVGGQTGIHYHVYVCVCVHAYQKRLGLSVCVCVVRRKRGRNTLGVRAVCICVCVTSYAPTLLYMDHVYACLLSH